MWGLVTRLLSSGSALTAMSDDDFIDLYAKGSPQQIGNAIKDGANVNARYTDGVTPLIVAAGFNPNPEVITALIKAGADVNARDNDGLTPLMWAAEGNSNPEVITMLIKAGANVRAKDKQGEMAIDYAKTNEKLKNTDAFWKLNDASY